MADQDALGYGHAGPMGGRALQGKNASQPAVVQRGFRNTCPNEGCEGHYVSFMHTDANFCVYCGMKLQDIRIDTPPSDLEQCAKCKILEKQFDVELKKRKDIQESLYMLSQKYT